MSAASDLQPCRCCGYMIRGGDLCGDCREYGPPRGWRWQYNASTGTHKRIVVTPDAASGGSLRA